MISFRGCALKINSCFGRRLGWLRMNSMLDEFADLGEQLFATVVALREDLLDIAFELASIFHGEVFGR